MCIYIYIICVCNCVYISHYITVLWFSEVIGIPHLMAPALKPSDSRQAVAKRKGTLLHGQRCKQAPRSQRRQNGDENGVKWCWDQRWSKLQQLLRQLTEPWLSSGSGETLHGFPPPCRALAQEVAESAGSAPAKPGQNQSVQDRLPWHCDIVTPSNVCSNFKHPLYLDAKSASKAGARLTGIPGISDKGNILKHLSPLSNCTLVTKWCKTVRKRLQKI